MDFLGLVGSIYRLIFVYKFNYKKQNHSSQKDYEKEDWECIKVGFKIVLIFTIVVVTITFFFPNW